MSEKKCDFDKIDRRYKDYTDEERQDKYRFQRRWKDKNNIVSITFRINKNTKEALLKFSKENQKSSVKVLIDAFEKYKTKPKINKKTPELTTFLESLSSVQGEKRNKIIQDKTCNDKKEFKLKKEFADELYDACKKSGYSYGYFITKILDDYMTDINKGAVKKQSKKGKTTNLPKKVGL